MFYYLKGTVAFTEPNMVVLDVGGVGYQLTTSLNSASGVKSGDQASFYTHLNVREDAVELFGFREREELACFRQLISVSGVGPKVAVSLLSALTPQRLALAVATDDVTALTSAQGVGKKLAQRIAMELRDKISAQTAEIPGGGASAPANNTVKGDALDALMVLGYSRARAEAALSGEDLSGMGVEDIVRLALKKLF